MFESRKISKPRVREMLENAAESHTSAARFVRSFALNITNLDFGKSKLSLSDVNEHKPF